MRKMLLALAMAPWICGCMAASAAPMATFAPACRINWATVPDGMHLKAVVYGSAGASGEYHLEIEKRSSAGTSMASQGGEFTLDRRGDAVVATDDFDTGSIIARLSVRLSGTNLRCSSVR